MPHLVFNAVFFFFFSSSPCEDIFSLLLEREEGGERNIDVKEKHQFFFCLPYMPKPGIEPATLVCASTGNQTRNPLVMG